ncbi:MAG: hypothetical protein M3O09_18170 [Acidobacteriota bacterium]|nr:hypothetical protein [Acidobacteriota bacterium]
MSAVGSPVDFSVAEDAGENKKVDIEQVGGAHESMIFELPDTRSGYILDLEIVNQTSKTLYCSDIELRVPWEDASFAWLPDPKDTEQRLSYIRKNRYGRRERVDEVSELYCFRGGSQLEYPRDEVLNHILLKRCTIPPHRPLKGLILATGAPMPNVLRHGQWLDATFSIIASDHDEFSVKAQFWVERLQFKPKPRTHNLYEPIGLEAGSLTGQHSEGREANGSKTGTSKTVRRTRTEDSSEQTIDY